MYLYGRKIAYKQRQEDNNKFYGAATGQEKSLRRFVFNYVSHTRLVSVALWIVLVPIQKFCQWLQNCKLRQVLYTMMMNIFKIGLTLKKQNLDFFLTAILHY